MKSIKSLALKKKRVFLRADLNVPLKNKEILQDYRLEKILPTINYIQKNGGKVILATHIGRPQANKKTNFFDEKLSTKILVPWFKNKNYKIKYEIDIEKAINLSKQEFNEILLLENLRFFNGEQGTLQERKTLANILKKLADVYVNDAFALIHRNDTSVTLLPNKFKFKGFGLLIEKEIYQLNKIKKNPKEPFIVIIGGNKIKTKLPLVKNLIEKKRGKPTFIIIGGMIAKELQFKKDILKTAKINNITILLPIDYADKDIGPKTIKLFSQKIKTAKTIFINGTMGVYEEEKSEQGTRNILQAIANSNAYTVAGGGDTVAAIFKFHLQNKFDYLSTGGGGTLAYLAEEKLNIT